MIAEHLRREITYTEKAIQSDLHFIKRGKELLSKDRKSLARLKKELAKQEASN